MRYRDASSLAREFELVRSHNGDLRVAGLSRYVRDILVLAGLSDVLEEGARGSGSLTQPVHAHELRAS